MINIDMNLLTALDVLLAEGSVTGAARTLGLSPSAMSRTPLVFALLRVIHCWCVPGAVWCRRLVRPTWRTGA